VKHILIFISLMFFLHASAQSNLQSLDSDVSQMYLDLGIKSNSMCILKMKDGISSFYKQSRAITQSIRPDVSPYGNCAFIQTVNVEFIRNSISESLKQVGVSCNAWKKQNSQSSSVLCQKGAIKTAGYWSMLSITVEKIGTNYFNVLALGTESRNLK
jgi:hypothetical protein